ncbi:GNAT family N-acetyltransferase [Streptomyces sp. NPDC001220]
MLGHDRPSPHTPDRPTPHADVLPTPHADVRPTPHADVRPTPHAQARPTPLHQDPLGPLDTLDLLDRLAGWGPTETPVGTFHLVPVHVERDLPIIGRWMNDPAVAAFWQLAGSRAQTEDHLRGQLAGDGRSVPCLGSLDGTPMSYWEIYRADLDPLARHYPARPHDTGVHLLIGDAADRGRGLGSALLRAVADLVLDHRPACARVVAEPDLRNTPSVAAFLGAGFRYAAEIDLPAKRAALMIRDRSLRHLM